MSDWLKAELHTGFLISACFSGFIMVGVGICCIMGEGHSACKLQQNILLGIGCVIFGLSSMSYPIIRFYRHIKDLAKNDKRD
jgi:hypothetical protein